ncbi:MAG TPA: phosphoribosylamine--glycine ligase, partial [Methylophilaceae bacterium]
MYFRLSEQGHEVKIFVESPESQDIYQGMLERVEDWAEALPWIREAGNEGIILFEGTGFGEIQDELRRDGYQVIGGSTFGDKLESDRSYGQQMFAKMGLKIVASHRFTDYALAIEFIHSHPARYVFKL